jgi:hypothetical protein
MHRTQFGARLGVSGTRSVIGSKTRSLCGGALRDLRDHGVAAHKQFDWRGGHRDGSAGEYRLMAEGDEIAAGREAWRRPCSRERKDFDDWLVVGRALLVGRAQALRIAGTSRPFGKRYARAMRQWLDETALEG